MIERAESAFIPVYLKAADFYINSILPYEFMVVAPMAYREIEKSLDLFLIENCRRLRILPIRQVIPISNAH